MLKRLTLAGLLAAFASVSAFAQNDFAAFRAPLSSSSVSPPIDGSELSGSALVLVQLNRDSSDNLTNAVVGYYVDVESEEPVTVTNLQVHQGASGETGDVVLDSLFGSAMDLESGSSQIFRETTVTSEEELTALQDLMNGPSGFYVNLSSMDNAEGAARGQLQPVEFDGDGDSGPSHSELFLKMAVMEETLARIARRIGVVPATIDDVDTGNGGGNGNGGNGSGNGGNGGGSGNGGNGGGSGNGGNGGGSGNGGNGGGSGNGGSGSGGN